MMKFPHFCSFREIATAVRAVLTSASRRLAVAAVNRRARQLQTHDLHKYFVIHRAFFTRSLNNGYRNGDSSISPRPRRRLCSDSLREFGFKTLFSGQTTAGIGLNPTRLVL